MIYSGECEDYEGLAEEIGNDHDHDIVENFDELENYDEHALIVCPFENVTDDLLLKFRRRLLRRGPEDGGFGIISARTAELAHSLYQRNDQDREHDVVASFDRDRVYRDEQLIEDVDQLDIGKVKELNDDGIRSISLDTSGWSIHVRLGDGFLCGFPTSAAEEDFTGNQPYCVDAGEMNCPLDDEILHSDQLNVSHFFIDSCASVINNNHSEPPVHVGLGLLSQVETLIGSCSVVPSDQHEIVLNHALLLDGYEAAERCYILCKNSMSLDMKSHPYVLFGDPSSRITRGSSTDSVSVERTDSGYLIEAAPGNSHTIDVRLPDVTSDRVYVSMDGQAEQDSEIYYTSFRDRGECRLIIYAPQFDPGQKYSFDVTTTPPAERMITVARSVLRGARESQSFSITDATIDNKVSNLSNQLAAVQEDIFESRFDVGTHERIEDRGENFRNDILSLQDSFIDFLDSFGMLHKKYGSAAMFDEVFYPDQDCHICGRELSLNVLTDPSNENYRAKGLCPKCGYIFDVPYDPGRSNPTYPVVSGNLVGVTDDSVDFTVTFENGDSPAIIRVVPILNDLENRREVFAPRVKTIDADPRQRVTSKFSLNTGQLEQNSYYVKCIVICNGNVFSGNHLLVVGDEYSRRPMS